MVTLILLCVLAVAVVVLIVIMVINYYYQCPLRVTERGEGGGLEIHLFVLPWKEEINRTLSFFKFFILLFSFVIF